ncbi:hypothetical protein LCGC14_0358020 [marine sediment metagenome]|uniref:Uncharacterized protein n=1 Tax=marine sediment metagenome TaxID=412755 RepID=A0A0F9VW35_9ZZZZ
MRSRNSNPVDDEMYQRLLTLQEDHQGKVTWLAPSLYLDCGKLLITTSWWYKWAGFVPQTKINYWFIPEIAL